MQAVQHARSYSIYLPSCSFILFLASDDTNKGCPFMHRELIFKPVFSDVWPECKQKNINSINSYLKNNVIEMGLMEKLVLKC